MLHEDVGSAHRDNCFSSLPGLQDALRQAKAASGVIVVTDVSRLSRNLAEYREHIRPFEVPIYSLREGRILSSDEVEDLVRAAETEAKRIGRDTKQALAKKDHQAVDTSEMRRRGSVWNVERQMRIEDDVIVGVQILRECQGRIIARDFGEELIRRGRQPPRGTSFTLDTARERLRAARYQIALEDLVNTEPDEAFDAGLPVARENNHRGLRSRDSHGDRGIQENEKLQWDRAPIWVSTANDERILEKNAFAYRESRVSSEPSCGMRETSDAFDERGGSRDEMSQPADFGTLPDLTKADNDLYHAHIRRRIKACPPKPIEPMFGPHEARAGDRAGRGVSPVRSLRAANPVPPAGPLRRLQGARCRSTYVYHAETLNALQRRSYGLCGASDPQGRRRNRPEP